MPRNLSFLLLILAAALLTPIAARAQTVTLVSLKANDLVYEPHAGRLYTSISNTAPVNPNTIVPIDPVTGAQGAPIPVGVNPNKLAVSDDGRYLYVGLDAGMYQEIQFDPVTWAATPGPQYSLGDSSWVAREIAVQPGNPTAVAIVRGRNGFIYNEGVAVYDNGIARPTTTSPGYEVGVIAFNATGSVLYGYMNYSGYKFTRMQVSPAGLSVLNAANYLIYGSYTPQITFSGGRVYAASGEVIDPDALTRVGILPGLSNSSTVVAVDASSNRAFAVKAGTSTTLIAAYDTRSFLQAWSFTGPGASSASSLATTSGNRLAFRTAEGVHLVDYSAVLSRATYRLRIDNIGTGTGTVTSSAGGITCGNTCSADFGAGAQVTLAVSAGQGSTFAGWRGDADCSDGVISMSGPVVCVAEFTSVTASVPVRRIAIHAADLLYDRRSGQIYASLTSDNGASGNSLVAIDPATGSVSAPVWVGSEPHRLAESTDGTCLYVGLDGASAVRRVELPYGFTAGGEGVPPGQAPVPGLQFSLGTDVNNGPQVAEDLAVQPFNRGVLAVSRRNVYSSPRHQGVAIFDSGVQRPTTTPGHTGSNVIEFGASPSTVLYGYNNETSEFGFRAMSLDATGVSITSTALGLVSGYGVDIRQADRRVYSSTGRIIDPETATNIGLFPGVASSGARLDADIGSRRVLFLQEANSSYSRAVIAYDMDTTRPVWTGTIPLGRYYSSSEMMAFVTSGPAGVAIATYDAIYLVDLAAVTNLRTVVVTKSGNGSGKVTAGSAIDCGYTCSAGFPVGTTLTLVATPQTGSLFAGWAGDVDCSDGVVTVTEESVLCTATFVVFKKTAPLSYASNLTAPVALSWMSLPGATYEVCVDMTPGSRCDGSWQATGASTTFTLDRLGDGTYYWQVRANGTFEADYGSWWSFTVGKPLAFSYISSSPSSPVTAGTSITWSTLAYGGISPIQYRFYRRDAGGVWTLVRDYSTSSSYTWTNPTIGTYAIEVWARSAGSANQYDAFIDSDPMVVVPRITAPTESDANPRAAPRATPKTPRTPNAPPPRRPDSRAKRHLKNPG